MGTDARRPVPPTKPIAEPEPPSRGPSFWGFGFLGLAVLIGRVPLGGIMMVQGGHHPQWVFLAFVVALGITLIAGIVGGVLLLRRPPRATWSVFSCLPGFRGSSGHLRNSSRAEADAQARPMRVIMLAAAPGYRRSP